MCVCSCRCACLYCMGVRVVVDWLNKHTHVPQVFPNIYSLFSLPLFHEVGFPQQVRHRTILIDETFPNMGTALQGRWWAKGGAQL